MPRKARSLADVESAIGEMENNARPRGRKVIAAHAGLSRNELVSAVCSYYAQGFSVKDIIEKMRVQYKVKLAREEPHLYIRYAAKHKWVHFVPPLEFALAHAIKNRYPLLADAQVVQTAVSDDAAYRGAVMLLELIRKHAVANPGRPCNIGTSGGHTLRRLVGHLATLLRRPVTGLPPCLVFHGLVASFDIEDPTTAPGGYFTYLANDPAIRTEIKFVTLNAPAMVYTKAFKRMKKWEGIVESYDRASSLDIIVTAAAHADGHSTLENYMRRKKKGMQALISAGFVGDMLWRPFSESGPIEVNTVIRAMTLMELGDLPAFIAKGKSVLLVLGPCGACSAPRTQILSAILNQSTKEKQLITHLAVDSRTAAGLNLPTAV